MKMTVLVFMTVMLAGMSWQLSKHSRGRRELKTATFAAGCFWGVQAAFDRVPGVVSTEAGYTGGNDAHPTHESVAIGHSGHVEAVRVTYDPAQVSYPELLDAFWNCHNPTVDLSTAPGEGAGRSMIFTNNSLQETQARQSLEELTNSGHYAAPVVTQVVRAKVFYLAEAEHQHFADRNGSAGRCAAPGDPVHTKLAAYAKKVRTAY